MFNLSFLLLEDNYLQNVEIDVLSVIFWKYKIKHLLNAWKLGSTY